MTDAGRALVPNTASLAAAPPAVLMGYQQEWVADDADFKVCEKGRRTGITWAEASDDVLIAASDRAAGGQNVYYIGTDKEMTEEYIAACAMWAKVFNYAAGEIQEGLWDEDEEDKHIKTFTIRFPGSGFKIVALASRPRKLRGRQGVLVGDEAAFQDDLQELLKAALAFLVWGGKVRLISTHDGADNAFNTIIQEIKAGKREGRVHTIPFDRAVADGLFERVCIRMGKPYTLEAQQDWRDKIYKTYGDAAEEELDCVPRNSAGAYLTRNLVESRMSADTPVIRLSLPAEFELWPKTVRQGHVEDWLRDNVLPMLNRIGAVRRSDAGVDFGRKVDLSVIIPTCEYQQLQRKVPFHVELHNVPFHQQEQVVFYIFDRLPRFTAACMDATGNGMYLAEAAFLKYGQRIERVMLSTGFYAENMPRLKANLQDGTLDGLARDGDVLDDLLAIEVVKGIPLIGDARKADKSGGKRHGDTAVALMLANRANTLQVAPIEFQSTGQRAALGVDGGQPGGLTDDAFGTVAGANDFGGFL
jgi:phage FluMu gp28-like protein